eukprot:6517468-Pyramimonas_sp.AAC.1
MRNARWHRAKARPQRPRNDAVDALVRRASIWFSSRPSWGASTEHGCERPIQELSRSARA